MSVDLKSILRERFGFTEFRPGQREAIEALLDRGRVICIQPTGHGKSLLYQLPATLLPGLTLVVSPLLALMRDQIGQLNSRFDIAAGAINSDQSDEENDAVRSMARSGDLRILFVAPEQFDNLETTRFLAELPIALLVVDEAHCISTWGHDFRPSYRQITPVIEELEQRSPDLRVLGLTATANARTEADIAAHFVGAGGENPVVQRASMDRPNIALRVIPVDGLDHKLGLLAELLPSFEGCGIIYCATRDNTETVAGYLSEHGLEIAAYHAGLDPDRKRELQGAFTRGDARVLAATNALGMGIDKPDIRFIVHFDLPGSITAYYQEVGRSGRDGAPAVGTLLFDEKDRRIQEHFIRSAQPSPEEFEQVISVIEGGDETERKNRTGVTAQSGLHPTKVTVILAELIEQGWVEKILESRRQVYARADTTSAAPLDLSRYERQLEVRTAELAAMLRYGLGEIDCLMQTLRSALGDVDAPRCGRCAACCPADHDPPTVTEVERAAARRWIVRRDHPIPASRAPRVSAGLSILDGEVRGPLFVDFMRGRAETTRQELAAELLEVLDEKLDSFFRQQKISAVAMVPSRTWAQRASVGEWLGERLGVPIMDLLVWGSEPEQRQGELLNNDQRRANVKGRMKVRGDLPTGNLLLVDDYHGCGATLKEAARALRKDAGFEPEIVPLAIARVRWRLGARGMI